MKKRTLIRRWHANHPLKSRNKWVRYAWLVSTTPIHLVLFPANAILRGFIGFYSELSGEIRDWIVMYVRAWSDAAKLGEDNDD